MVEVSPYAPPRTAMVPPAAIRSTAFWIVFNGAASVPALLSLPVVATYSVAVAASAEEGTIATAATKAAALSPYASMGWNFMVPSWTARRLLVVDVGTAVLAVGAVRAGAVLGRLGAGAVADVLLADHDLLAGVLEDRDVAERRGVAVVGVDAGQRAALVGRGHVADDHGALRLPRLAVAARAVQLAEVLDLEAVDDHRAAGGAVVLEHLVGGVQRATAEDRHGRAARLRLERRGVLADVLPPDVLQRAGRLAVHAVGGRAAEDDVLQRAAVRQVEQRVLALGLTAAAQVAGAVVALHAAVEGAADHLRG